MGDYAKVYGSSRCVGVLGGGAGGGRSRQEMQRIDIGATPDIEVREALLRGEPFVLTGLDVGACVAKWSARYLHSVAAHKQLAAQQLPALLCVTACFTAYLTAYFTACRYLHSVAAHKQLAAGVHVCASKAVDLAGHRRPGTRKNFHFAEMPFGEFVQVRQKLLI